MDQINLITIVIAVITAVAAIWKAIDADFWKKTAMDSFELVEVIKKSKEESSPGGKEITLEEKGKIADEAMDVALPLWDKFEKWIKKRKSSKVS